MLYKLLECVERERETTKSVSLSKLACLFRATLFTRPVHSRKWSSTGQSRLRPWTPASQSGTVSFSSSGIDWFGHLLAHCVMAQEYRLCQRSDVSAVSNTLQCYQTPSSGLWYTSSNLCCNLLRNIRRPTTVITGYLPSVLQPLPYLVTYHPSSNHCHNWLRNNRPSTTAITGYVTSVLQPLP